MRDRSRPPPRSRFLRSCRHRTCSPCRSAAMSAVRSPRRSKTSGRRPSRSGRRGPAGRYHVGDAAGGQASCRPRREAPRRRPHGPPRCTSGFTTRPCSPRAALLRPSTRRPGRPPCSSASCRWGIPAHDRRRVPRARRRRETLRLLLIAAWRNPLRHRKSHLFPAELPIFAAGHARGHDAGGCARAPDLLRARLSHDLHDPALAGRRILVIPSAVGDDHEHLIEVRTRAQAEDNEVFAIAAQLPPGFCGHSMVVDPRGRVRRRRSRGRRPRQRLSTCRRSPPSADASRRPGWDDPTSTSSGTARATRDEPRAPRRRKRASRPSAREGPVVIRRLPDNGSVSERIPAMWLGPVPAR